MKINLFDFLFSQYFYSLIILLSFVWLPQFSSIFEILVKVKDEIRGISHILLFLNKFLIKTISSNSALFFFHSFRIIDNKLLIILFAIFDRFIKNDN
jgi:hypothetical protein